jgi:hypothetical protein
LLVYALCQHGDAAGAGAELEKLKMIAPRHAALMNLEKLVEIARARAEEEAKKAPSTTSTARASVPAAPGAAGSSSTASAPGLDVDSQVTHAASLHRRGDLSGAERVYQNVLKQSPQSIAALSGLGDIARQRRASATAAAFYDQVLKLDRNHLPTLMARGDMYWYAGNRVLAVALYRRALGQVGTADPLGKRALRRIEEFETERQASGALVAPATPPATADPTEPAPAAGGTSGAAPKTPAGETAPKTPAGETAPKAPAGEAAPKAPAGEAAPNAPAGEVAPGEEEDEPAAEEKPAPNPAPKPAPNPFPLPLSTQPSAEEP